VIEKGAGLRQGIYRTVSREDVKEQSARGAENKK